MAIAAWHPFKTRPARRGFSARNDLSQRMSKSLTGMPKTLKAAAAQKVATKLLKAGLVREIKAKTGMEAWRRDVGAAVALRAAAIFAAFVFCGTAVLGMDCEPRSSAAMAFSPASAGIELVAIAAWHPFKTRRRVADLVRETICRSECQSRSRANRRR